MRPSTAATIAVCVLAALPSLADALAQSRVVSFEERLAAQRPIRGCTPQSWYQDVDGDGYGNPAVTELACDAPEGFVAAGDDCDDGNPAVHPGAAELCNGIDDNCDGSMDQGRLVRVGG